MKKMNAAVISALSLAFLASCGGGPKEYNVGSNNNGLNISVTKAIEGQDFKAELGINTQQITEDVIFPETLTKLTSGNKELKLETKDYTYTRKDDNKKADLVIPAANVVGDIDIELSFELSGYLVDISAGKYSDCVTINKPTAEKGKKYVATISVDSKKADGHVLSSELKDITVTVGGKTLDPHNYTYDVVPGSLLANFEIESEFVTGDIAISLVLYAPQLTYVNVGAFSSAATIYTHNGTEITKEAGEYTQVAIYDTSYTYDFTVEPSTGQTPIKTISFVNGWLDQQEYKIPFKYSSDDDKFELFIDTTELKIPLHAFDEINLGVKTGQLLTPVRAYVDYNENVKEVLWFDTVIQKGTYIDECIPYYYSEQNWIDFEVSVPKEAILTNEQVEITSDTDNLVPEITKIGDNGYYVRLHSLNVIKNFSVNFKPIMPKTISVTAKCQHLKKIAFGQGQEFTFDDTEKESIVKFDPCGLYTDRIMYVVVLSDGYGLDTSDVDVSNKDLTVEIDDRRDLVIIIKGELSDFTDFIMTIKPHAV